MNWRLLTIINATIALVTVGAVIFDVTRTRTRGERSRGEQHTASHSNTARNQAEERTDKVRIETVDDLTDARVDDLGAVPALTLTELMRHATPEQLAAMALKFNDAPTDARTFGGMGMFFQAWAELDPKAALTGAFRINDVAMRKIAARTVVGSVSPSATPDLIAYLTQHPDKDLTKECKNEFLGSLVANWSQLDPEAASRFMDELGAPDKSGSDYNGGRRARQDIAYNWATLDPTAALEWVSQQKGKDFVDTNDLSDEVIKGWCRKDIDAAAAYVAQHLDEPDIGSNTSSVVIAMLDRNVDQATAWVSQLPPGDSRDQAERALISSWAESDPSSAAQWVALLPVTEQTGLTRTIAENWVATNWPDASRWINTLTGDVRDEALVAATHRDGATQVESLALALSIGQAEMRDNAIENIVRNWASTDATAAEAWLKGSPLSTEQRDHLQSVITETQQSTAEVERVIIN